MIYKQTSPNSFFSNLLHQNTGSLDEKFPPKTFDNTVVTAIAFVAMRKRYEQPNRYLDDHATGGA
ncbi:MAG: hypothetical protein KDH98_15100 [Calditrichaeota bacterium]|nr:hypothetical protein [Calditrichota bacterium]